MTESAGGFDSPENQYLSRGEAARRLGVPPRTIQQWARDGRIPCIRTFGGHRRFAVKDVDALTDLARRRRSRQRTGTPSAVVGGGAGSEG